SSLIRRAWNSSGLMNPSPLRSQDSKVLRSSASSWSSGPDIGCPRNTIPLLQYSRGRGDETAAMQNVNRVILPTVLPAWVWTSGHLRAHSLAGRDRGNLSGEWLANGRAIDVRHDSHGDVVPGE